MRQYLRARRQYWEQHPAKRSIVGISALLSVLVVALSVILVIEAKTRYDACFHTGVGVAVVGIWLKYGYDKLTT